MFTGDPLPEDLLVIGVPEVALRLASSNPRADLFVRLCEVDSRGVSRAVTDGYRRLSPDETGTEDTGTDDTGTDETGTDETGRIRLELAPLAHRFAAGSRLRVQVSSGAHPLHLRNPGTDDPVRDHSRLIASEQTVRVGGSDPATLTLPAAVTAGAHAAAASPAVHRRVPR